MHVFMSQSQGTLVYRFSGPLSFVSILCLLQCGIISDTGSCSYSFTLISTKNTQPFVLKTFPYGHFYFLASSWCSTHLTIISTTNHPLQKCAGKFVEEK